MPQTATSTASYMKCELCKVGANQLKKYLLTDNTQEMVEKVAIQICGDYVVKNDSVCHGAVTEMTDIIGPVLYHSVFEPEFFCAQYLGYCSSSDYKKFAADDFVEKRLATKPKEIQNDDYINNLYKSIKG